MNKKNKDLRPVDAPLYGYWQTLYLALYSRSLYVDVAKRWRGYGVRYMILLLALAIVPLSARIIISFNQIFDEQMVMPLNELPRLYVQNGEVIFDKPMPYFIKNKVGSIVAIIDTTGAIKGPNKTYPQVTILITKNQLFFRIPSFPSLFSVPKQVLGDDIYVQPFNKNTNEVFMAKEWVKSSGIIKLKWITELLVYPLMAGFVFGLYTMLMLFFAFVGQLFSQIIFKYKLTFKEACRLLLVASTAETVVFFAILTANISPPGGGTIYVVLLSVYFSYAVISVRNESKKMVLT